MDDNTLNWPDLYMEFADELLKYKNNRTELIEKIKMFLTILICCYLN